MMFTGSRQSLIVLQMLLEGSENQTPRICLPAAFPRVRGLGLWTEWMDKFSSHLCEAGPAKLRV